MENLTDNTTSDEFNLSLIPSIDTYYKHLDFYLAAVIVLGNILVLAILILFARTISKLLKQTAKQNVTRTILICSIYPIVTTSSLLSIMIPKMNILCDTISHVTFMICAYIFFCSCLQYAQGETVFIKRADQHALSFRTPPCCCFFVCMKRHPITKNKFIVLRLMILQLPIIQTILFIILNVLYIEVPQLYLQSFIYIVPFMVISILIGVWGLNVAVRMIAPYFPEQQILAKYFALQIVLLLCKIQPAIAGPILNLFYRIFKISVEPVYFQFLYKNATVNLIIIGECLLLFIWAFKLYTKNLKR